MLLLAVYGLLLLIIKSTYTRLCVGIWCAGVADTRSPLSIAHAPVAR